MFFIYFVFIVLLFAFPKSKVLFCLAILLLWTLFAFNYDNADRHIYEGRFYEYANLASFTEPTFTYIVSVLSSVADVQSLYIFAATIYLLAISFFISKFTQNIGFPLACYMLSIFFRDVVQLRFTMSLSFAYFGIYYLLLNDKRFKSILLCSLMFFVGATIHGAIAIYVLLIFAKYLKNVRSVLRTTILLGIVFVLYSVFFAIFNKYIIFEEKSTNVYNYAEGHMTLIYRMKIVTEIVILSAFEIYYCMQFLKKRKMLGLDYSIEQHAYYANILILSLIPLFLITMDFHRLFHGLFVYNMVVFARNLRLVKIIPMYFNTILISLLVLRVLALGNPTIDTVFFAVLHNNLIISK